MMMSSGVLSQEEIDALLRGAEPSGGTEAAYESSTVVNADFSDMDRDVVGEIANISMGTAATTLSTLLGKKVDITTPTVSLITKADLQKLYPAPYVVVDVHYTVGLQGNNVMIIKERDVAIICDLMMGGDGLNPPSDLSEMHFSAISEAMNQMMGSASTSMATMLAKKIDISPPKLNTVDLSYQDLDYPVEDPMIKVSFKMVIEGLIDSELMQLYPIPFAKSLVEGLMGGSTEQSASTATASPPPPPPPPPSSHHAPPPAAAPQSSSVPSSAAPPPYPDPFQQPQPYGWGAPPGYPPAGYPPTGYGYPPPPTGGFQPQVPVQPVQFAPLPGQTVPKDLTNLGLIMDVPLQVTVELGKARKSIKEILEMGTGSVIELDKLAGEAVDILINGKLLAKGEVVVIDENFGVRITDIVNPVERIANLQ